MVPKTIGRNEAPRRSPVRLAMCSLVAALLAGFVGCDKIPTWQELTSGKKEEKAPTTPVAAQPKPQATPAAPVKPAEFVVFRIAQLPSGGGVEE